MDKKIQAETQTETEMEVEIIIYATKEDFYMKWLLQSFDRHNSESSNNIKLKVLGIGTKWNNYMDKVKVVFEYLKSKSESQSESESQSQLQNKLICVIDAYDVLINTSLKDLKTKYLELAKGKIVISKQGNLTIFEHSLPFLSEINDLMLVKTFHGAFNAGVYMGKFSDIMNMYSYMIAKSEELNNYDDQYIINIYIEENRDLFYLDNDKNFICTIYECMDLFVYDTKAYFIHKIGNGSLINYLKFNGYEITEAEQSIIRSKSLSIQFEKTKYHTENFLKNLLKIS